jgi:hypothetical protein
VVSSRYPQRADREPRKLAHFRALIALPKRDPKLKRLEALDRSKHHTGARSERFAKRGTMNNGQLLAAYQGEGIEAPRAQGDVIEARGNRSKDEVIKLSRARPHAFPAALHTPSRTRVRTLCVSCWSAPPAAGSRVAAGDEAAIAAISERFRYAAVEV